jgi:putative PIN family toxin of toxin-antitoxin system
VSFLIGKQLDRLDEHLQRKKVVMIPSRRQALEIAVVLERPHLCDYVTQEKRMLLDYFAIRTAQLAEPKERIEVCRDTKDNYLLEIAVAGKADCIVTGDQDLLVLHPFHGIEILSYREFERRLTDL